MSRTSYITNKVLISRYKIKSLHNPFLLLSDFGSTYIFKIDGTLQKLFVLSF